MGCRGEHRGGGRRGEHRGGGEGGRGGNSYRGEREKEGGGERLAQLTVD